MTKLLSVQAAADLLSISPWTVRRYITQGKLLPVRIGRRVVLQEEEIQRFVISAKVLTHKPDAKQTEGVIAEDENDR